jgi:thymidine kinase
MFSGKSSELLRKIRRYQHAKKNCLVVNYLHDNRYSSEDVMATHDK